MASLKWLGPLHQQELGERWPVVYREEVEATQGDYLIAYSLSALLFGKDLLGVCGWLSLGFYYFIILFKHQNIHHKTCSIITLILKMRKVRPREIKWPTKVIEPGNVAVGSINPDSMMPNNVQLSLRVQGHLLRTGQCHPTCSPHQPYPGRY